MLPFLWLLFTIIFAYFAWYHYSLTKSSIPKFAWTNFKRDRGSFENLDATEALANLKNFLAKWNQYIDDQNKSSFRMNRIAAISYLITAIMSFVAMIVPGDYSLINTLKSIFS